MSNKPFELRPSGFIEFEHVDLSAAADQAQTAVDAAMDTDPLSVNFERRKDHKSTAAERALAGTTIDWLVAFPADSRPKALCELQGYVYDAWRRMAEIYDALGKTQRATGLRTKAANLFRRFNVTP